MNKINHPAHYSGNGLEAITVIEKWALNFNLGNAIKYICRRGGKAEEENLTAYVEDLQKAVWYLTREIESVLKFDAGISS